MIKKIKLTLLFALFSINSFAQESKTNFPRIDGEFLLMLQSDYLSSAKDSGANKNNNIIYGEADFALRFDRNWSLKTNWRFFPESQLSSHQEYDFQRYHSILNSSRGFNIDDPSLIIEELKVDFVNEDLNFFVGKFDPEFGKAFKKEKRIGVYTWLFNEDYNLREKIGGGVSALLENSKITFNTFFNDTTSLSKSALNERGRAPRTDGISGSNGTLSSYSVSMEGQDLFNVTNLYYNLGYRNLGINEAPNRKRESGYTLGLEYLFNLNPNTKLIPLLEIVKINNFGGAQDRDALYYTLSAMATYSSWSASLTYNKRNIDKSVDMAKKINDKMFQMTIGYKINQNMTFDFTRAMIDENGYSATAFGANLSYLVKF